MTEPSDEALMRAYAEGDMPAFERLYQRYRGPLYRYILRLVGDAPTANDLYQGSWEKIIGARRRYRASAPFRAWMFRIAHNHVVDHYRRTRSLAPPTHYAPAPDDLATANPGPEQALAGEQAAARLEAAVRELPDEQRQAVLLKLEAGLDLRAIAEVTGVNPETAKSRLRYATARLKAALAQADEGP
jgi:RNA polymerase sigma-70 factor (ECF subfamily)